MLINVLAHQLSELLVAVVVVGRVVRLIPCWIAERMPLAIHLQPAQQMHFVLQAYLLEAIWKGDLCVHALQHSRAHHSLYMALNQHLLGWRGVLVQNAEATNRHADIQHAALPCLHPCTPAPISTTGDLDVADFLRTAREPAGSSG